MFPYKEIQTTIDRETNVWVVQLVKEGHIGHLTEEDWMALCSTLEPTDRKEFWIVRGKNSVTSSELIGIYRLQWKEECHAVTLVPLGNTWKNEQTTLKGASFVPAETVLVNPGKMELHNIM